MCIMHPGRCVRNLSNVLLPGPSVAFRISYPFVVATETPRNPFHPRRHSSTKHLDMHRRSGVRAHPYLSTQTAVRRPSMPCRPPPVSIRFELRPSWMELSAIPFPSHTPFTQLGPPKPVSTSLKRSRPTEEDQNLGELLSGACDAFSFRLPVEVERSMQKNNARLNSELGLCVACS